MCGINGFISSGKITNIKTRIDNMNASLAHRGPDATGVVILNDDNTLNRKKLAEILEVDYETMFRKSFVPIIEKMFQISKWIGEKDSIRIEKSGMFNFFG